VPPLPASVIGASSGAVYDGAQLFQSKACIACHSIGAYGGHRGPDLTDAARHLSPDAMTIRILNGATNMPAYAGNIDPEELRAILAFLATRGSGPPK
jgi:ubiquinol-cytochrome c reductase cytochrome b subunit